jgi:hypothetical protein
MRGEFLFSLEAVVRDRVMQGDLMAEIAMRGPLAAVIRAVGNGELPRGWLCLADGDMTPQTNGILLVDTEDDELDEVAVKLGYPQVSLDTDVTEDICHAAQQLVANPTDEQLLRCFKYYHDFDAFIPSLDAPDPPPAEESMKMMDREFYGSLGAERTNVACRNPGCPRGAIEYSIFCRPHHFESVQRRESPFTD